MKNKMYHSMISVLSVGSLLLGCQISHATATYIPAELKQCVKAVNELAVSEGQIHFQELIASINEDRILLPEGIMRKAVGEALNMLEKEKNDRGYASVAHYLQEYLNGLNDRSIVLSLQNKEQVPCEIPFGMVNRSLGNPLALDIMAISNEIADQHNFNVSGLASIDLPLVDISAESKRASSSLAFNSEMMTNSILSFPNIIFGTGTTAPSISAWALAPSNDIQSPINMQFSVPSNFIAPGSLELLFLVTNQSLPGGTARIELNAKYIRDGHDFSILSSDPHFTQTMNSNNFTVNEPRNPNNVKLLVVKIDLKKSKKLIPGNLAFYSITRQAPTKGTEYAGDIYLVAATFKYKS